MENERGRWLSVNLIISLGVLPGRRTKKCLNRDPLMRLYIFCCVFKDRKTSVVLNLVGRSFADFRCMGKKLKP